MYRTGKQEKAASEFEPSLVVRILFARYFTLDLPVPCLPLADPGDIYGQGSKRPKVVWLSLPPPPTHTKKWSAGVIFIALGDFYNYECCRKSLVWPERRFIGIIGVSVKKNIRCLNISTEDGS